MPTRRAVSLPLVTPIVPVLRDQPFDDPAYLFEPPPARVRTILLHHFDRGLMTRTPLIGK